MTLEVIAGDVLFATITNALKPWQLGRVRQDVSSLSRVLTPAEIRRHYLADLAGNVKGTIAELFVAARIANWTSNILPHAPGPKGRNFDILATFSNDARVAIECKHQVDRSPFDGVVTDTVEGIPIYSSVRPGADPRFLDQLPPPDATSSLPASSIWKDAVLEALTQLQPCLPGIVALSIDDLGPMDIDIEAALLGDEVLVARPKLPVGSTITAHRLANGVFTQPENTHLAAVWAFRLTPHSPDEDGVPTDVGCDFARLYRNAAAKYELPVAIGHVFPHVRDYRPGFAVDA